ncbi:MAG: hypothetical protein ACSLEN_02885 [Candidatus Malihini olakiniferum]
MHIYQEIAQRGVYFILGVGGGRVIDCAKRLLMGWIMWPGNHVDDDCRHLCGLWSTISILYDEQGKYQGTRCRCNICR